MTIFHNEGIDIPEDLDYLNKYQWVVYWYYKEHFEGEGDAVGYLNGRLYLHDMGHDNCYPPRNPLPKIVSFSDLPLILQPKVRYLMSAIQLYDRAYNEFTKLTEADFVDQEEEDIAEQWAAENECSEKYDIVLDALESALKFNGLAWRSR